MPAAVAFPWPDGICLVDWRDFDRTEYVTDFIAPQEVRYSAGFSSGDRVRSPVRMLMLHRTRSSVFREREIAMLATLRPHVQNLLSIHERIRSLEAQVVQPAELRDRCRRLTRREAEVAALLCTRLTVPEIATKLMISPRTVEAHVAHMFEKLNVCNRSDLIRALRP